MTKGVNKVILIGTLGRDPEIRYTPRGKAVANMSIATHQKWKDKQSGETHEHTEWHRVVFVGRRAEQVSEYLKKGQQVYVEGHLQTRKWQDQAGAHRVTEIIGSDMQMLGGHSAVLPT